MNKFLRRVAWGMRIVNTPPSTPGGAGPHSQPPMSTRSWRRAQIGTRPVQMTAPGDAGQSIDQVGGQLIRDTQGDPRQLNPRADRLGPSDNITGLNYGPPVIQIPRFFRAANRGYAGVLEDGWPHSGDNYYIIKRPLQRFPTRGARSVSGAMNPKSRWDDMGRAPSVFVPTTPVRGT